MTEEFELCTRDTNLVLREQLATPAFKDHIDYAPYRQFSKKTGKRVRSNLMSSDWAWKQAVSFPSSVSPTKLNEHRI